MKTEIRSKPATDAQRIARERAWVHLKVAYHGAHLLGMVRQSSALKPAANRLELALRRIVELSDREYARQKKAIDRG